MKISAVVLGPGGVGIVAQVSGVKNMLRQLVSLGVGPGVTKYTAEFTSAEDAASLERLLRTSTTVFLVTGVLVFAGVALFADRISALLLSDPALAPLVVMAAASVPLVAQVEIISRILQGMLLIRAMVLLSLASMVAGLVVLVPLILLYDVTGAVLSILVAAAISLVISQLFLRRVVVQRWGIGTGPGAPDTRLLWNLLRFGGANASVLLSTMVALVVIRSLIIRDLGAAANGEFEVAWGVSNQYLSIVSATIWTFGMPKVATILDDQPQIERLQNDAFRLSLIVLVPLVVLLLLTRELWIPLLFSASFMGAYGLVGYQFTGDVIRSARWAANIPNAPKERFLFMAGQAVGMAGLWVGLTALLLPRIGVVAAPVGYLAGQALMLPVTMAGHWWYDRFTFEARVWALFAGAAAVVALTVALTQWGLVPGPVAIGLAAAATAAWAALAVSRDELRLIIAEIQKKLKRR